MFQFPLTNLLDEQACYDFLVSVLHPDGLHCPNGHPLSKGQAPHDRHRAPILDYRCRQCGAVYNVFTGTHLCGIHYPCSVIVQILKGFCQATPTQHLADELGIDRGNLLEWRHRLQGFVAEHFPPLNAVA